MKPFITLFLTVFLVGVSMETQSRICLSSDRQIITIKDLVNRGKVILSQDGHYLLYEEKRGQDLEGKNTAIVFLDLETQEKKEFLSGSVAEKHTEVGDWKYLYKFSKDETSLFGFARGGKNFKVWRLPGLEERIIPVTEGRGVLSADFLEDGRLLIVEMEKDTMEFILPIQKEVRRVVNGGMKEAAAAHVFEYYSQLNSSDYFIRVVDPFTLDQSERVFHNFLSSSACSILNTSFNQILHVREDGSITATSLTEEKEPVEIFGSVKGFTLSSNLIEINKQCTFPSESLNILRAPEGEGYIFRDLKEGKEFYLSPEFLIFRVKGQNLKFEPPFLHVLEALVKYPFILSPLSERAYHIPSGQMTMMNDVKKIKLSPDSQVSLELRERNGKNFWQVVSHPLNPYQREMVFEIDNEEVCNINMKEGVIRIMSFEGDIYSIEVKSAVVRRKLGFPGQCFLKKDIISGSGTTFLGINREGEHVVHRLHEQCIEPPDSINPEKIKEQLVHLSQSEDPSQSPHLSALVALLEDKNSSRDYPELLGKAFWNILFHSPTLYLELHRRYPDVGDVLPVTDTYPEFDSDSLTRLMASVHSILKLTTSTIHYTQLSQWNFLRMLRPLLQELPKADRELYMERITVSISNGAAKAILLLQDVFQSKIYYAIKGHIEELFGLKRQPVSDVSVIRRRAGGMATVILSSDLIEGHADVSTDFGLHYAVVEKINHIELEGKKGSTLDRLVEWNLFDGKSYRAKINVHIKRNHTLSRFQSPDYTSIWEDHKMVGMVVIGSSLRDFTGELTKQYLSYFQDQGFQFSKKEDTDLKKFLLEKIRNCEVDYFLKESHSDGDERNVFRFSRGNHVIRGARYGERGQIEVVYIIFPRTLNPEEDSLGTDLLSNKELGQAIVEREAKGCGQITYFNTSCWSHVKARYEIEAVNSFLFLNIPSLNLSDTFANSEDNAIRILLDSYRQGRDFNQFREALKANKGYSSGSRNSYIFPDEGSYGQKILSHIFVPLDIQIQLERREGEIWKTINPDEAL